VDNSNPAVGRDAPKRKLAFTLSGSITMRRDARRPGTAGFALVEALVSLLLLAIALLGAGRAVVEAMAGQHAALLRTRAADLASDLAEAVRGSSADAALPELVAWQSEASSQLPRAYAQALTLERSGSAHILPADHEIVLQWRGGNDGAIAELRLPVSIAPLEASP
jgi:type II secretory pathway pseudopilin PulG